MKQDNSSNQIPDLIPAAKPNKHIDQCRQNGNASPHVE